MPPSAVWAPYWIREPTHAWWRSRRRRPRQRRRSSSRLRRLRRQRGMVPGRTFRQASARPSRSSLCALVSEADTSKRVAVRRWRLARCCRRSSAMRVSLMCRSAAMRSWRSIARVCLRRGIIKPRPCPGSAASLWIAASPVGVPGLGRTGCPRVSFCKCAHSARSKSPCRRATADRPTRRRLSKTS